MPLAPHPAASYTIPNTNPSLTRKAAPHAERYRHHHHPADHPVQPLYAAGAGAPLRRLQTLTTAAKYPDTLLDACLAFFRAVFAGCASLALVRQVIGEAEELDLSERLPVGWVALPAEVKAVIAGCAVETARVAVG